jgi:hypothetical protein
MDMVIRGKISVPVKNQSPAIHPTTVILFAITQSHTSMTKLTSAKQPKIELLA